MSKFRFATPARPAAIRPAHRKTRTAVRLAATAVILVIALAGLYRSVDTAIGAGTAQGDDYLPGPRCMPAAETPT